MPGAIAEKLGTILPQSEVELAKALNFEEPPEEWMRSVRPVNAQEVRSDTIRYPIFQAPALPWVKGEGQPAARTGFTNYYQDMTFDVLSIEQDWSMELQQDLPDFDLHVRQKATENGINYRERAFQWRTSIMTGSAVDVGLPTITTTSYDGLSYYSSSTRWRTTSGNIIAGSGMAGPLVRLDFFRAIDRLSRYKHDLSDAKIWTKAHSRTYLVEFAPVNWQYFIEAFNAEQVVQTGGYTQSASNQYLAFAKSEGVQVILMTNAYLSGDTWYGTILDAPDRPAILYGVKDPPHTIPLTEANSADMARRYTEGTVTHGRVGITPGFPGSTFKVTN